MRISDWSSDVCSSDLRSTRADLSRISMCRAFYRRFRFTGGEILGSISTGTLQRYRLATAPIAAGVSSLSTGGTSRSIGESGLQASPLVFVWTLVKLKRVTKSDRQRWKYRVVYM